MNGIIPQRSPGADVVGELGNQKRLSNLGRTCKKIRSGVEQTVDDRRSAGVGVSYSSFRVTVWR